jgi:hypothetical protein
VCTAFTLRKAVHSCGAGCVENQLHVFRIKGGPIHIAVSGMFVSTTGPVDCVRNDFEKMFVMANSRLHWIVTLKKECRPEIP